MPALDAVVFDLDGTLCVRDRDDEAVHEAIFEQADLDPLFDPEDVYAVDPSTLPPADSSRAYWETFYRAVLEHVGEDPEHASAVAEATMEAYVDDPQVSFREGAREALDHARERYDVCLVTNGSRRAQSPKLSRLGVEDAFDATVFCGPGTGVASKPDPEPFHAALEPVGVVPERAMYVGDRLDGDVTGAHNAGMASVWVPEGDVPPDPEPEPTHVLDSIGDLRDVL